MGPSGCGKSTILRLISGLDIPDDPTTFSLHADSIIGYVFQESNLLPWLTVFDNIFLPLRLSGHSRASCVSQVRDMLERVYLPDCELSYPYELSGGMAMRVSIARALITRPTILLLDEPFASLDEITRFRLNDLLLDLHSQYNFTLVLVTHSIFESAYLSDRVAMLSPCPGRVCEDIDLSGVRDCNHRSSSLYGEHCSLLSSSLSRIMGSF